MSIDNNEGLLRSHTPEELRSIIVDFTDQLGAMSHHDDRFDLASTIGSAANVLAALATENPLQAERFVPLEVIPDEQIIDDIKQDMLDHLSEVAQAMGDKFSLDPSKDISWRRMPVAISCDRWDIGGFVVADCSTNPSTMRLGEIHDSMSDTDFIINTNSGDYDCREGISVEPLSWAMGVALKPNPEELAWLGARRLNQYPQTAMLLYRHGTAVEERVVPFDADLSVTLRPAVLVSFLDT